MEETNKILLVFDNVKELDLLEKNLTRNGFEIFKSSNLKDALDKAKKRNPDLIVVNTSNAEQEIEQFGSTAEQKYAKRVLLPGGIALEDYLTLQTCEHVVIKGLARNKIWRDKKTFFLFHSKME